MNKRPGLQQGALVLKGGTKVRARLLRAPSGRTHSYPPLDAYYVPGAGARGGNVSSGVSLPGIPALFLADLPDLGLTTLPPF